MKASKFLTILLILSLILAGCGGEKAAVSTVVGETSTAASVPDGTTGTDQTQQTGAAVPVTDDEMFTDRDLRTAYEKAAEIILNGSSASAIPTPL